MQLCILGVLLQEDAKTGRNLRNGGYVSLSIEQSGSGTEPCGTPLHVFMRYEDCPALTQ